MSATDGTPAPIAVTITPDRLADAIAWASSPLNISRRWGSVAPLLIRDAVADILRGLVAIDDPALHCRCGHLQVWHADAGRPCFGAGWDGCRCTGFAGPAEGS